MKIKSIQAAWRGKHREAHEQRAGAPCGVTTCTCHEPRQFTNICEHLRTGASWRELARTGMNRRADGNDCVELAAKAIIQPVNSGL